MEQRSSLENNEMSMENADKYSKNAQANLCHDYTGDEYDICTENENENDHNNDHDDDIQREDSNIDKAESNEKNSTFHTSTADTTATIGVTIGANRRADIMKTMSMNTHVSDDVRHVVVTNIDVVLRNNPKAYKK